MAADDQLGQEGYIGVKQASKKSEFREGRWGLSFKDGKLYEFTERHVLVMKGWPEPMAWFTPWRCSRTAGW